MLFFCKMYSVDELIYQRNADTNALLSVDELVHAAGGLGSSKYSSSIAATTAVPAAVGGIVAGTVNSTLADKTFSQLFDLLLFRLTLVALVCVKNIWAYLSCVFFQNKVMRA